MSGTVLFGFSHGSEIHHVSKKSKDGQRAAKRLSEDPILCQVKKKLLHHSDKYKNMTNEELTEEAINLTDPDRLRKYFRDLTHSQIQSILLEVNQQSDISVVRTPGETDVESIRQDRLDRVSSLTLKLHLSHAKGTPNGWTHLGTALLNIPYGVMHASLEIGDSNNPTLSYIVEFTENSLVQPRRKLHSEASVFEATINLGGKHKVLPIHSTGKCTSSPTTKRNSTEEPHIPQAESHSNQRTLDVQNCTTHPNENEEKSSNSALAIVSTNTATDLYQPCVISTVISPEAKHNSKGISDDSTVDPVDTSSPCKSDQSKDQDIGSKPAFVKKKTDMEFFTSYETLSHSTSQDLTHLVQMSLSKISLVDKLIKVIVLYNKRYYYSPVTRNGQTFLKDVLKSLGVWKTFEMGASMEKYLSNLKLGKEERYKSHKAVNDRVIYLQASGEISELTYDELQYYRSLYKLFHLEESSLVTRMSARGCQEPDCCLHIIEKRLNLLRPKEATTVQDPTTFAHNI